MVDRAQIAAPKLSRKAQVLAFIEAYLDANGYAPVITEIADGLHVSETRAKTLVHRLAAERMIERRPGAQRAISIPGRATRSALDQLRADGWIVDEDAKRLFAPPGPGTCPKGHLPLIAILEHIPDVADGYGGGDGNSEVSLGGDVRGAGARTAARRAPRARPAAAEAQDARAA